MSTLKATLPTHLAETRAAEKPFVVGPRTLLSIFLTWIGLLTAAFVVGLNLA